MEGWIKIDRRLLDWEWYDTPGMVRLWIHLLLMANHEDKKWRGQTIKRGQLLTSLSDLGSRLGFSRQNLRTMLARLQNTGEINQQTCKKYTLLTICKYETYQQPLNEEEQLSQPRTNQQLTNNQPTERKFSPTPPLQREQEGKKEKESIPNGIPKKETGPLKIFRKPTVQEIQEYCDRKGYKIDAEHFFAHYESNGWMVGKNPMKSWQAALVTWNKSEYRSNKNNDNSRIHITGGGESPVDYGESTI